MALSLEAKAAVLADNLSKLHNQNMAGQELRITYLADLAHLFADRIRHSLSNGVAFLVALSDATEAYLPLLSQNEPDGEQLSLLLAKELSELPKEAFFEFLPVAQGAEQSIAYVRHRSADLALASMSDFLTDATMHYADDMREACGAVVAGECAFCLLPVENEGVVLQSTRQMLQKHSLYTVMSVSLEGVRYLLLSRSFYWHSFKDRPLCLSIAFPFEQLGKVVALAKVLCADVFEVNSYIQAEKAKASISFSIESELQLRAVLLYCKILLSDAQITGFYQNLEEI